jgi:hypothetical protein
MGLDSADAWARKAPSGRSRLPRAQSADGRPAGVGQIDAGSASSRGFCRRSNGPRRPILGSNLRIQRDTLGEFVTRSLNRVDAALRLAAVTVRHGGDQKYHNPEIAGEGADFRLDSYLVIMTIEPLTPAAKPGSRRTPHPGRMIDSASSTTSPLRSSAASP